jgi:hypothetical protein
VKDIAMRSGFTEIKSFLVEFGRYVWMAPIGIAVPVGLAAVFLFSPQMPDVLAGMRHGTGIGSSLLAGLLFSLAAAWFGLSCWHWNRAVLAARTGTTSFSSRSAKLTLLQRLAMNGAVRAPIALVVVIFLLVIYYTNTIPLLAIWPFVATMTAVLLLLIYRQNITEAFHLNRNKTIKIPAAPTDWSSFVTTMPPFLWGLLRVAPFGPWVAGLMLVAPFGAVAVIGIRPTWLPSAPVAGLLALGLIVGPLAVCLAALQRIPVPFSDSIGAAALLVLLYLPPWEVPGLYDIRSLDGGQPVGDRPEFDRALDQWADRCFAGAKRVPVVIVAAEGGASRGAVWLLSAMKQLDAVTDGAFGKHVFAISGVSGGSLGAVTYLQMLRNQNADCQTGLQWERASTALNDLPIEDFLAPTLASYFLTDTLHRLFIVNPSWDDNLNRANALEQSFERFWARTLPPASGNDSFLALFANQPGRPHLILNGTDVRTGRRVLTSTVRFAHTTDLFADADDFLDEFGKDIRPSTAVTNSARFPLVSPTGNFTEAGVKRQIVDGGYFDNYGVTTADEVAQAVVRHSNAERSFVPLTLVVSNDAAFEPEDLFSAVPQCGRPPPELLRPALLKKLNGATQSKAYQFAAILGVVVATRGAQSRVVLEHLRREYCAAKEYRIAHIALPKPSKVGEAAPMNWVLNEDARNFLYGGAIAADFNQVQISMFAKALRDADQNR